MTNVVGTKFTSHLIQNDPEIQGLVRLKLDQRMNSLKEELEAVTAERATLDVPNDGATTPVEPATTPKRRPGRPRKDGKPSAQPSSGAPANGPRKPGRPSGEAANHGPAIVDVVTKTPGMGLTDVFNALVKAGHACEKKTISTYLSTMSKAGHIKAKGERPNTKYYPGPKKK